LVFAPWLSFLLTSFVFSDLRSVVILQ